MIAEVYADQAKMEAEEKKMTDSFKAADTDGDELLNEAEYLDFIRKVEGNAKADGYHHVDVPEADVKKGWEAYCRITGKGGVDLTTLMTVGEKAMLQAMKNAGLA